MEKSEAFVLFLLKYLLYCFSGCCWKDEREKRRYRDGKKNRPLESRSKSFPVCEEFQFWEKFQKCNSLFSILLAARTVFAKDSNNSPKREGAIVFRSNIVDLKEGGSLWGHSVTIWVSASQSGEHVILVRIRSIWEGTNLQVIPYLQLVIQL